MRDHPDQDALRGADRSVSYGEFGALVADTAKRLGAETAPGEFVGIQATRGVGTIVAMAGALAARRPFVFLDGRDSDSSNASKVRLLGVRLVARAAGAGDGGAGDGGAEIGEVPSAWLGAGGDGVRGPLAHRLGFAEDEVCYAIQTSGSTGEPKCVLVRGGPLAPVIHDHVERLEPGPGSRTLQFARLTFDGCITEILWTLTSGATLVVLEESYLAPGPVLQGTLERFGITHLKTTPFALTVTEPTGAMRLAHVVNGGGACRPAVLKKWSAVAAFHNAYGLTETTVCNLLTPPLDPERCRETVPLGDLVGECGFRLRAVEGEGAGSGEAGVEAGADTVATAAGGRRGELVITGDSVAVGYLTEQGLHRFGAEDGGESEGEGAERAYRTGDMVELRDGQLSFVQRLDRQVKVRGFRLDPGEVESAVCRLDAVRDAVVVAESHDGTDAPDADALVCYYQGDADPRAVRRHLEGVIDPYKIPSVFEHVATFPYTPNGKVDRESLRAGRRARAARDEDGAGAGAAVGAVGAVGAGGAPAGAARDRATADRQMLSLARSLTGVADVGLDDNFFDVGGDSASAVVLVARMKELGWTDVGVRDVLRAENLRVLADQLHERGA